jgi:phosphoglycerol transferase MdoB-like AlkP superfamily enzyme
MKNKTISYYKFLLSVQILGILFFSIFRLILLASQKSLLSTFPSGNGLLVKALLMGLRFDLVIACYILLLPLFLLSVSSFLKGRTKFLEYLIACYFPVLFIVAFFICASDIPYFSEFNKHINGTIFTWLGNGSFVTNMILHEPRYYLYFFVFLGIIILYLFVYLKISKRFLFRKFDYQPEVKIAGYFLTGFLSVLLIGLCILGIRGRTSKKSPIRVGTAFFSNYSFPNQLGLNPVFVLMRSTLDMKNEKNKKVDLIRESLALDLVKRELLLNDSSGFKSPIARYIHATGTEINANVVVILMESMSAHYMNRFGGNKRLTPFLDSIFNVSLSFDNFYSDGIHTMNGMYATLCSYPSILTKHPLDQVEVPQYMGLPYTLRQKGYVTCMFITHDDQFDNVGGFFAMNGFERIIAQKDYPPEKVLSTLGVPDDYMFSFSIPYLNKLHQTGRPFFVFYMTASNHGPIIIPEYFKPTLSDEKEQAVQYSDWALRKFFLEAQKEEWFENTIFVFLADHGNVVGKNVYDMSYSYNHIPLIIYSKRYVKPFVCNNLSGQVDVFPIVMGLLNMSYLNNTFGVNTLVQKRPYMFFSADDKIGCVSDSLFSIDRINMNHSLFKYRLNSIEDLSENDSDKALEMKNYARSMIQSAQYIISEKLTLEENK